MKGWPAAQAVVGVAMLSTVFFTVTGFLWWLALNVAAGVLALAAVASPPARAPNLANWALWLFVPFNTLFGLVAVVSGGLHPVPLAVLAIAGAQVLVWRASRPAA